MTAAVSVPIVGALTRRFPDVDDCSTPPGDQPCRRTECRYHLAHREHWGHRLEPSRDCALAVANEGPHTLDEVADVLGMSKERARQIEAAALIKLERNGALRRFYDESE